MQTVFSDGDKEVIEYIVECLKNKDVDRTALTAKLDGIVYAMNTEQLVNRIFDALETKSYLPSDEASETRSVSVHDQDEAEIDERGIPGVDSSASLDRMPSESSSSLASRPVSTRRGPREDYPHSAHSRDNGLDRERAGIGRNSVQRYDTREAPNRRDYDIQPTRDARASREIRDGHDTHVRDRRGYERREPERRDSQRAYVAGSTRDVDRRYGRGDRRISVRCLPLNRRPAPVPCASAFLRGLGTTPLLQNLLY